MPASACLASLRQRHRNGQESVSHLRAVRQANVNRFQGSGFVGQRVQADITSILVGNKFIRVNLSVFDNDGMEGFYVPQSAFRDMIKDAGAQVLQNNINLDSGAGSELSGEAIALQALQNAYQSASSAVSANIRKNKAKIKYNTIVYLINKEVNE